MSRPKKPRQIQHPFKPTLYKPQGVAPHELQGLVLSFESLEALRLADDLGMDHAAASRMMGVSRPTFSRILKIARQQVARALTRGWAIRIEGTETPFTPNN